MSASVNDCRSKRYNFWHIELVEDRVVVTTDSLETLRLIHRRDSALAPFIIENFCESGIEVRAIFEFPYSNHSHKKIVASCYYLVKVEKTRGPRHERFPSTHQNPGRQN